MKRNNAIPWWGWFAWILAIVLGVVAYYHLPAQVPTHYDWMGKVDRIHSRLVVILYEPALMLVIILLWQVLWRIDPRKQNYESFWTTYRYIGGVIVVFVGLIYLLVLGHILHLASMRFLPTVLGIMFMLLANVLPRLQPNWWLGIRTPWTLSSGESWNRTRRLGGQLGVPMGMLIIILAWVLPRSKMMVLAILLPIVLWAFIMVAASYFYAKGSDSN